MVGIAICNYVGSAIRKIRRRINDIVNRRSSIGIGYNVIFLTVYERGICNNTVFVEISCVKISCEYEIIVVCKLICYLLKLLSTACSSALAIIGNVCNEEINRCSVNVYLGVSKYSLL